MSALRAPVLVVPRPDGSMRVCVDCCALNEITARKRYPLPRIDDLVDSLSGAKRFSSLDLASGYHHLVLSETGTGTKLRSTCRFASSSTKSFPWTARAMRRLRSSPP